MIFVPRFPIVVLLTAVAASSCAQETNTPFDAQGSPEVPRPDGGGQTDAALPAMDAMPLGAADVPAPPAGDARPADAPLDALLVDVGPGADAALDAAPAQVACPTFYRAGHGDVSARYDAASGRLSLALRSHLVYPEPSGELPEHDPVSICIVVPYSSYESMMKLGGRPAFGDPDAFAPIGVPAGAAFWILEARNLASAQPFLGVASERVSAGLFKDPLMFELRAIAGPPGSHLSIYQVPFLPRFFVSTSEPERTLSKTQAISLPVGGHDHFNWTFSHPGTYDLTFVVKAERSAGGVAESAPVRFRFIAEARQ